VVSGWPRSGWLGWPIRYMYSWRGTMQAASVLGSPNQNITPCTRSPSHVTPRGLGPTHVPIFTIQQEYRPSYTNQAFRCGDNIKSCFQATGQRTRYRKPGAVAKLGTVYWSISISSLKSIQTRRGPMDCWPGLQTIIASMSVEGAHYSAKSW
jgi:hypothetical protein